MTLLVIDTQKLITTPDLYHFDVFVANVKKLIDAARQNHIEVIYIRHNDGEGEELSKGTEGFEVAEEFKPMEDEMVFDKTVNSPFKESGLFEYLQNKNERQLIVTGLQTDYCIDATVKCGFEHGFDLIVPQQANSTFDNEFMSAEESYRYYNEFIWNDRYARCLTMQETMELMRQ